MLTLASVGTTEQAKNAKRYDRSLTPNIFKPLTPSLSVPSPNFIRVDVSALAALVWICDTSGTTISVPVKSHLSPG